MRATQQVELEPYAAASAAEKTGYPVALTIVSPDIAHGASSDRAACAWTCAARCRCATPPGACWPALQRALPEARLEGFCVQAMAQPAHARELIVGARIDPLFGPVILLGQGGDAIDAAEELAVALPPLNLPLARALVQRSGRRGAHCAPMATRRPPTRPRCTACWWGCRSCSSTCRRSPSST